MPKKNRIPRYPSYRGVEESEGREGDRGKIQTIICWLSLISIRHSIVTGCLLLVAGERKNHLNEFLNSSQKPVTSSQKLEYLLCDGSDPQCGRLLK